MINIRNKILSIPFVIFAYACMSPEGDELWIVSIDATLMTGGFARDVSVSRNKAYVAAGQSGIQIWDLEKQTLESSFDEYWVPPGSPSDFEDLSLIEIDTLSKLIFASEPNQDVMVLSYSTEDTLIYYNKILSIKTKEFISFPIDSGVFVIYAADNDDGMKWSVVSYFPDCDGGYFPCYKPTYPTINEAEIKTIGKPRGIDSDGSNYIAMATDQLGVDLYSIDSIGSNPKLIGRVDTEGNAEKVTIVPEGVFVACDDAGAAFIPIESFSESNIIHHFAENITVNHIAVEGSVAALSLGKKGIAVYDISEPTNPIPKGLFDIGYSYKAVFWSGKLLVCTREGLKILNLKI